MSTRKDDQISRGFDEGNYANAYETTHLERALRKVARRSPEYRAAFTLGFFSSYERDEMGADLDAYDDAYALVGKRAVDNGYIDARDESRSQARSPESDE